MFDKESEKQITTKHTITIPTIINKTDTTTNINIIEEEPITTPIKYELQVARKKEKASRQRKASKLAWRNREQQQQQQQEYYAIKETLQQMNTKTDNHKVSRNKLQHDLIVLEQQNPQVKKRWQQRQDEEIRHRQQEQIYQTRQA